MRTMQNWIGFAAYLNQDCFASSFFSNIVSQPIMAPVFRREHASGMYSVHMYYFGNWLSRLLTMGFYPVMLISIIFYSLGLVDSSMDNYVAFLKCGALQSLNGVTLGHMWGAIFDNEINAIISGLALMNAAVVGSGHVVSRNTNNIILKYITKISPMGCTLELYFRRILSQNVAKNFFIGYFHLDRGEANCENFLIL